MDNGEPPEDTRETAYLRAFESTNQCELTFLLKVDIEEVGLLEEEVRAVRQITDTVQSLLQHTVNKVKHSIKTLKGETEADSGENDVKVNVALMNEKTLQPIKNNRILKSLIESIHGIEFWIFDQRFVIVINAPLVKEMKLPQILYANFTIQPIKVHCLFADHGNCQFSWYKSKDKENWTQVGSTYRYNIADTDVGHYLKLVCVPANKVLAGPSAEVVSANKVDLIQEIPTCPFEERHKFTTEKLNGNQMVSYNILSSRYTETNDSFPYCPPKVLAIDYRKQLIAKELLGYQADIICLQEVDTSVFSNYYKDIFKDRGYMSHFHRKGNKISEGLACFFNKKRFKKIDDHQIIYSNRIKHKMFTYLWNFVKVNSDLSDCFMRQMTSLQITILKENTSKKNQYVIIGNTHLFYHPEAELVRVVQIHMATTYLHGLSKLHSQQNASVRVILCGDFNSIPTSSVYEYMTVGKLTKKHKIFEKTKNKPDLCHSFQFESACGSPKYTNYTADFRNCLDYIFIEKQKMKVKKIVPFPNEKELEKYDGLPNDVYPSDHLALVVNMEMT